MKNIAKFLVIVFLFFISSLPNETIVEQINTNTLAYAFNLKQASSTKNLKNIAVFIKFNDSDANVMHHLDDEQSVENANQLFNSDILISMNSVNGIIQVPSFKKYYERESYGDLSITTEIFPKIDGKVVAYQDKHPIGYYLKYNVQNAIGYKNTAEALEREKELINNAVAFIENQVLLSGITSDDLDKNNDGFIDAISFVVEGQKNLPSTVMWGDLLWSHQSANKGIQEDILGKNINAYTFLYAEDYTETAGLFSLNRGKYGTIIHEFGHVLGYRDLYRYENSNAKPVGFYDIMGDLIGSNPQSFLTYFISDYTSSTHWHNPLPVIEKTTENIILYKPKFQDKNEKRAVKLKVGGNEEEYFIVEYHNKLNTYESHSADASGIIIYRVNEKNKFQGNNGTGDLVYVFRPNETGLGDGAGDLSSATFNNKRPIFGKEIVQNAQNFDNQTIHFSDGSNSGLIIEVINETTDSIAFNVTFPKVEGEGTKEKPYLIRNVEDYLYLMKMTTLNKYYKLMNDIDFKNILYPSIDFEGNIDGNHKTLKNITSKNTGVFNSIGNFQTKTKIENLTIENIIANADGENYLGGFSNVAQNILLQNVHVVGAEITHEGAKLNNLASTGGFLGNADNQTNILNCSANATVRAPKNVGGFLGLNQNAIIKDSFAKGKVYGTENIGAFFGLQAITDSTYHTPENVYFDTAATLKAVGGYAKYGHNLNVLDASSLANGIRGITVSSSLSLKQFELVNMPIKIEPNANLTYQTIFENPQIASYQNGKIEGLNIGMTTLFIDINIGSCKMRFSIEVTINTPSGVITEKEVLNFLGLTKKEKYVVGFALGTKISSIKQKLSADGRIELKGFFDESHVAIKEGIVATGITFTLCFNQKEYTYTIIIKGDVNGDGFIYATDYVKIRNHIMGKSTLNGAFLLAADINNDGFIYATDYVQIKNHIMGKSKIHQTFTF